MKKTALIFCAIVVGFLFSENVKAQSIKGKQIRVGGGNVKLECKTVEIPKVVSIVKVKGNNMGFWIKRGKSTFKKFWKPNDASAIGLQLQPGKYCVYPNLSESKDTANVILYYK